MKAELWPLYCVYIGQHWMEISPLLYFADPKHRISQKEVPALRNQHAGSDQFSGGQVMENLCSNLWGQWRKDGIICATRYAGLARTSHLCCAYRLVLDLVSSRIDDLTGKRSLRKLSLIPSFCYVS